MKAWIEALPSIISYVIAGREKGEKGTKHFQGYACFAQDMRLTALKKVKGLEGAHWEAKKGSVLQAATYCKKEGDFLERGIQPPEQTKRALEANAERYKRARDMAISGDIEGIGELDPTLYIQHYSTLQRIKQDNMPKGTALTKVCGLWVFGPSGCGKTQMTRTTYPDLYPKPANKWWDGYKDHKVVCLDDVEPSQAQWLGHLLKIWADSVPFIAEIKGGSRIIRPSLFIVTSQYSITEVFPDTQTYEAISRRFKEVSIKEFKTEANKICPPSSTMSPINLAQQQELQVVLQALSAPAQGVLPNAKPDLNGSSRNSPNQRYLPTPTTELRARSGQIQHPSGRENQDQELRPLRLQRQDGTSHLPLVHWLPEVPIDLSSSQDELNRVYPEDLDLENSNEN